jgi:hypothetical protein
MSWMANMIEEKGEKKIRLFSLGEGKTMEITAGIGNGPRVTFESFGSQRDYTLLRVVGAIPNEFVSLCLVAAEVNRLIELVPHEYVSLCRVAAEVNGVLKRTPYTHTVLGLIRSESQELPQKKGG